MVSALTAGKMALIVAPVRSAATRIGTCSVDRPRLVALPPRLRDLRSGSSASGCPAAAFSRPAIPCGFPGHRSRRPRRFRPEGPYRSPAESDAASEAVLTATSHRAADVRTEWALLAAEAALKDRDRGR